MRGSSTGDPASHRTQDKRSHPASGAQAGTGRNALRPETVAEMRGASEKRPSAAIMLGRRLRIQRNLGQRNKPLCIVDFFSTGGKISNTMTKKESRYL